LTKADLFDNPKGKPYRYEDRRVVTRTPEKDFPQSGNKNSPTTVLYRRREVIAAIKRGETICLVEGEKDADMLWSIGIPATCAPMGAKSFHKVDASPLYEAKEIIAIVDDDEDGETKWAPQVQSKIDGKVPLGFMKAAEGCKDAADHISAGYALDQLRAWVPPDRDDQAAAKAADDAWLEADHLAIDIANEAYRMKVRDLARQKLAREAAGELTLPDLIGLTEFLAQPDPPDQYLIEMNWPKGGRVLFSAQWKAGKSTARDNVARSLADGEPFLGVYKVKPITEGTIVIFDDELHRDMLRRWLREQGIVNTDRVVVVPMRGKVAAFDLTLPAVRAMWVQRLRDWGAVIVLLDQPFLDRLARTVAIGDDIAIQSGDREARLAITVLVARPRARRLHVIRSVRRVLPAGLIEGVQNSIKRCAGHRSTPQRCGAVEAACGTLRAIEFSPRSLCGAAPAARCGSRISVANPVQQSIRLSAIDSDQLGTHPISGDRTVRDPATDRVAADVIASDSLIDRDHLSIRRGTTLRFPGHHRLLVRKWRPGESPDERTGTSPFEWCLSVSLSEDDHCAARRADRESG
jgi:AAA domain